MNDSDITSVLMRLVGPIDDRREDWDDVVRRSQLAPLRLHPGRPRARRRPLRRMRGVALVATTTAVAAVLALTLTTPWSAGPTMLDRAAAAIAAPTSAHVFTESFTIRGSAGGRAIPVQVWVDGTSSSRFRLTSTIAPPLEIGGRIGQAAGWSYTASDDALTPLPFTGAVSRAVLDPAAFVRESIAAREARVDGRTTINGREVVRLRVESRDSGSPRTVAYYFADSHTYRPVRVVIVDRRNPEVGFPLSFLTSLQLEALGRLRGPSLIVDFDDYRFLRPTPQNRKLADIKMLHPHAKVL